MAYIDRDKLLEELQEEIDFESAMYTEEQNKWFKRGLKCAYRDAKNQPTADVVEVVRCKDCIHFETITLDSGISVGLGNCKNKNGINLYPNETDFCSYGERNLSAIPTGCERSDT